MKSLPAIIAPLTTEKSALGNKHHKYVFLVEPSSGKIGIKQAISELYKVDVTSVNITRLPEKSRRVKNNYQVLKRPDLKKAVVTIKKGQAIDVNKFKEKK